MPVRILAKRYAKAVLDLAVEAGQVDQIGQQLSVLHEAVLGEPRSRAFWSTKSIGEDEKRNVLQDILEAMDAHGVVRNTINFMLERRRLMLLPPLVEAYQDLARAISHTIDARVVSATELTPEQLQRLAEALKQAFGQRVELVTEVDKSLVGGLRVETEGRIIDGSVRGRLAALAQSIK